MDGTSLESGNEEDVAVDVALEALLREDQHMRTCVNMMAHLLQAYGALVTYTMEMSGGRLTRPMAQEMTDGLSVVASQTQVSLSEISRVLKRDLVPFFRDAAGKARAAAEKADDVDEEADSGPGTD